MPPIEAHTRLAQRLIVALRPDVQIDAPGDAPTVLDQQVVNPIVTARAALGSNRVGEPFGVGSTARLIALARTAVASDPSYHPPDFLRWASVLVGAEAAAPLSRELAAAREVEWVHPEPAPTDPPVMGDDPMLPSQRYLNAAPEGVDARYAWTLAGGNGAGSRLVSVERGWYLDHEDLRAHAPSLIGGLNDDHLEHGTASLGLAVARDNTLGCIGVAPAVDSVRCAGQWRMDNGVKFYSSAQAIFDALEVMEPGDVLLVCAQMDFEISPGNWRKVPVERYPPTFDMIRLAAALGLTVVEAAGNGGGTIASCDLDELRDDHGDDFLRRASPAFRDSGAIMVGASSPFDASVPGFAYDRLGGTCSGSRVDCFSWGGAVFTLSSDRAGTQSTYDITTGTSAATPVIAGVALAVQGMARAVLGYPLSPLQLRQILSDPTLGTSSRNGLADGIGVMPNLRAIASARSVNASPDVYVRDFVGDTGAPHRDVTSSSPDVIVGRALVADAAASFGEGSGTESSMRLGDPVVTAGVEHYVYIRAQNRGAFEATGVTAAAWWAPCRPSSRPTSGDPSAPPLRPRCLPTTRSWCSPSSRGPRPRCLRRGATRSSSPSTPNATLRRCRPGSSRGVDSKTICAAATRWRRATITSSPYPRAPLRSRSTSPSAGRPTASAPSIWSSPRGSPKTPRSNWRSTRRSGAPWPRGSRSPASLRSRLCFRSTSVARRCSPRSRCPRRADPRAHPRQGPQRRVAVEGARVGSSEVQRRGGRARDLAAHPKRAVASAHAARRTARGFTHMTPRS